MSLKSYIQFEPTRFGAALLVLGTAVCALLVLLIPAAVAAAIGGIWVALVGIYTALFTRSQVTPNVAVPAVVESTIKALAPFAPTIETVVVPVATSPLLPAATVLHAD
jgi:hypothetical protein